MIPGNLQPVEYSRLKARVQSAVRHAFPESRTAPNKQAKDPTGAHSQWLPGTLTLPNAQRYVFPPFHLLFEDWDVLYRTPEAALTVFEPAYSRHWYRMHARADAWIIMKVCYGIYKDNGWKDLPAK